MKRFLRLQQLAYLALMVVVSGLHLAVYSLPAYLYRRHQRRLADERMYNAGHNFALIVLQAGLNPVALLLAIEGQTELTSYEHGAVVALQINPETVRALLQRHYG